MASTKTIHSEERCFWIQKSNACTKAKIGTAIGIAALAAIAVVAGLFLVLAQHGVHIGGLNSMAQMMDARWLYVGMGMTSAALITDVACLIVFLRSARKKIHSKDEQRETSSQSKTEQNPKDFIKGFKEKSSKKPEKKSNGTSAPSSPKEGKSSTQNAGSQDTSQSSEEANNRKIYKATELPKLVDWQDFKWFTDEKFLLNSQEYYPINFTTQDQSIIYAIAWREESKAIERKYFTTEQDRKEHIKTLPGYLNYPECDDCIFDSETGVIKKENLEQRCQVGEFFPYTLNTQNMTLYIIVFRSDEKTGLFFDYWNAEDKRTQALNTTYSGYKSLTEREAAQTGLNKDSTEKSETEATSKGLNKDNIQKPESEATSTELNEEDIQKFIDPSTHSALTQFCHNNPPPNYNSKGSIEGKNKKVFYPLACGGEQTPHYFTTEDARYDAIEKYEEISTFLTKTTQATILSNNLSTLLMQDKMYFKTAYSINTYSINNKKLYVIIYRLTNNDEKIFTYKTFPSLEDLNKFRKNNTDFVEVGTASATSQSKNGLDQIKVSQQHANFLKDKADEFERKLEYATFDIASEADKTQVIYSLTYSIILNNSLYQPKVQYFYSTKERQNQIDILESQGYKYSKKVQVDQVFYGVPEGILGDQGLEKKFHIIEILRKPGDTFTFECQVNDKTLYAWATLSNGGTLAVNYAESESGRQDEFFGHNPPINDHTAFINRLDHRALEETKERLFMEKNIDHECPLVRNAWLEEGVDVKGQKIDIFFYRKSAAKSQHSIRVSYSEAGQIWSDIKPNLGTRGYELKSPVQQDSMASSTKDSKTTSQDSTKGSKTTSESQDSTKDSKTVSVPQNSKASSMPQDFKADDEFDTEIGAAMFACSCPKENLRKKELGLFVNEYTTLEVELKVLQQNGYHEAIFPLLSRDKSDKVTYRYFKTDEARKNYLKNSLTGYVNGRTRHANNALFVRLRAFESLKKTNTTDPSSNTLMYAVFTSPYKNKIHLVAVKYDRNKNARNDFEKCVVVADPYASESNFDESHLEVRANEFLLKLKKGKQFVNCATLGQQLSRTEKTQAIENTKNKAPPLKKKEFVKRSYLGYYVVVFVHFANQLTSEEKVYLASDPELPKFIESLKKKGYSEK